ncbi:MAG: DapH/DapD/GlmU-related protein, partial [Pseudomonadota bacterium]
HPYKEQKLIVVGDRKMALFDDVAEKDKLLLYSHKIDWIGRVPVPRKEDAEVIEFEMTEPLRIECQHFLDCLESRQRPKTNGQNGLRVLQVLEACQESLEHHGRLISPFTRKSKPFFAHETVCIDEPCDIGEGTRIWHFSHIMKDTKIGKNCNIGQNVVLSSGVIIGNNVKIQNNVSLYEGVTLEDDVFCGPSMVFTNILTPRSEVPRNTREHFLPTLAKKGATLGANCTIICGNTIGRYAMIGAGAVVSKDVPDHAIVTGNPARIQGWACECGLGVDFVDSVTVCSSCGKKYQKEDLNVRRISE